MSRIPTPAVESAAGAMAALCSHGARAAGRTAAMVVVATPLLLGAPVAWADHGHQTVEGAYMDGVRVQPTARQFTPPNQPDVSASAARDIDALYRQLIGPMPTTSSDSRSSAPTFRPAK